MKPTWHNKAWGIHQKYMERAQKKGSLTTDDEQQRFLALAIAGEAGELGNLYKKHWRGDDLDFAGIAEEMADVRIYLEHLATHLGVDLDAECEKKLVIVEARLSKAT